MAGPHMSYGTRLSIAHLCEIGSRIYVLISVANPKITSRSVKCVLIGYASNSKAYWCWHQESGRLIDSHDVTFVEHLSNQPCVLHQKSDEHIVPNADAGAIVSPPAQQPVVDSGALPLLEGMGTPSLPTGESTDIRLRHLTRNQVPACSWEDINDSLVHGGAIKRALREVCEAAS